MKVFETIGYTYEELNEAAKEKVKQWYLSDETWNDIFENDILYELGELFPNSDLKIQYSLSYCQGDGFNIYGTLNLYDFIDIWTASENDKKIMLQYLEFTNAYYKFDYNNRYGYSMKFIDKRYIKTIVNEMESDLRYYGVQNIDRFVILDFLTAMIEYFEELDKQYENRGYFYFYNIDEAELNETCNINEWYFDEFGKLI